MLYNRKRLRATVSLLALALAVGITFFVVVMAARGASLSDAPWGPNVKIHADPPVIADQNMPALAASKTTSDVFAVWVDSRNYDEDIYFAHSHNGGTTWEAGVRVNHDGGSSWQFHADQHDPNIAFSASGALHVVWIDNRAGTPDIYHSRSVDGGATWSTEERINDVSGGVQQFPAIAALDDKVCIVWVDGRVSHDRDVYVDCSLDGGVTWGEDILVSNNAGSHLRWEPDLALGTDGCVHVVWADTREGNWDIYYTAISAEPMGNVRLNETSVGEQYSPSIAANGDTVLVAWADYSSGATYVLSNISTDNGVTWDGEQPISAMGGVTGPGSTPKATFDERGTAWVAWQFDGFQLFADAYGLDGWSPVDTVIYQSPVFLQSPVIAAGAKQVYVAWEHCYEPNNADVLLSVLNGAVWGSPIQINDEGSARQTYPALAMGSMGRLHAAWADSRHDVDKDALYVNTSLDGGATWGTEVRVDDDHPIDVFPDYPAIGATDALTVHVVWASVQTRGEIYYDRSGDGAQTWGVDQLLAAVEEINGVNFSPDLTVHGTQKVFVVWAGYDSLHFVASTDGGTTWSAPATIFTVMDGLIDSPTIVADVAGTLHLAWNEDLFMYPDQQQIVYARSLDDGVTWSERQFVAIDAPGAWRANPDIAVNPLNGYVHLVWDDNRNGATTIFHAVSSNNGVTWETPAAIMGRPAIEPAVAIDANGVAYVLWQDGLEGDTDIAYSMSKNDGASWSVPGRVNDDATTFHQRQPAVVAGNGVYAVWNDFRRINWDIEGGSLLKKLYLPIVLRNF